MELVSEFIGAPFENGGLLLDWPGVPPRSCVFVPLILREGGVLAAIPSGFLDASLISAGQAGAASAIVGPSREVSVGTLEEEEEGALVPNEEMCTVLLVDFSEEVYPLLSRYDPVTSPAEAAHVVPESPHLQVSFEEAKQSALAWVASEEGERLAFYSAAEGADPVPAPGGPMEAAAPKRKTAPRAKRPTNAQLSEQGALVELIPSLTQQVQELATRQTALEKRAAPVAAPPLPAHRLAFPQPTAAPVPETPLRTLGSLVGPPPRAKAVALDLPQPGDLEPPDEEIKLDPLTGEPLVSAGASSSGLEKAMLQQSRALGTLVSHLVSQADASDPALASLGGIGVGFPGFSQEGEAAGAACKSQWEFSSPGEPASVAEAGPLRAAAHEPSRPGAEAPRVYFLRRALRRVWQPKKLRDSFLVACQHCRLYDSGRPGRSRRAHCSGSGCSVSNVLKMEGPGRLGFY